MSIHASTSCSSRRRGGRDMMPGSDGLKESAVAGRPSVTRFTQSSATGDSTSGSPGWPRDTRTSGSRRTRGRGNSRRGGGPRMTARKTQTTSPMLDEMR